MSLLDEAYRTLKDPVSRAEYLLDLHRTVEAAPDRTADGGADLLVEQMELRATLAEAASRADPEAAVATVMTELTEQCAALDKTLHSLFADPSPRNLSAAATVLRQRRFLVRCRRDVQQRTARLALHG